MRGSRVKKIRKMIYGDHSFRERRYGAVLSKDGLPIGVIVEVGRRGFERRWRRGTLLPGMGLMDDPVELAVAE